MADPTLEEMLARHGVNWTSPPKSGALQHLIDTANRTLREPIRGLGKERMTPDDINALLGSFGGLGMTAFHGSPHKFQPTKKNPLGEFDTAKIGTGEGAQAYGHGLYLAEKPGVAGSYQTAGKAGYTNVSVAGRELKSDYMVGPKGSWQPDAGDFLEVTGKEFGELSGSKAKKLLLRYAPDNVKSSMARIPDSQFTISRSKGNLYTVDLPDEHIGKMLDWNLPVSKQPENVKTAIRKLGIDPDGLSLSKGGDLINGAEWSVARGAAKRAGFKNVEEALGASGVPGIKYLDQGSRAAGEGSRNFVVFPGNEGILKILKRE